MTQQRLDNSNIGTTLEQVGREAVAQRVQRHALLGQGKSSAPYEFGVKASLTLLQAFATPSALKSAS